ncbi:MAG: family 20 glycosylhydrolase [Gemmatimonadetes bacterium]|nr:family 20 glycosylhydrolase [Gemmatimonadota bacterium]
MTRNAGLAVASALLVLTACMKEDLSKYPLIPYPEHVASGAGSFLLSRNTTITTSDSTNPELRSLAEFAAGLLAPRLGTTLAFSEETNGEDVTEHSITLDLLPDSSVNRESYRLVITTSSVKITASEPAGVFYGLQTFDQLIPRDSVPLESEPDATVWPIPAVTIEDSPRFRYRGMHLDVGRHVFPVEFIKKYIDLLAMYKMNTFHWHLTEDQGWRIEIKKYTRLTEVGALRSETILQQTFDPFIGDGIPYGGFYTQEEVREIVEHARTRYVTVIPEIEMPGHSLAALAAYPEYACTEGPFEVATRWGVHPDIYCPKEETFAFLEDVLTEVMDLFPGTYIHIGGDEAPKTGWEQSPLAQQVIEREGLADEHELQSYFIQRIEKFLLAHGRRLIGWDEILEGGLAPEATVMSWRGMAGGIEAAQQGHDVIMTPTSHAYFDFYQGDPDHEPLAIGGYTPLEKVYAFEPVPDELTPDQAEHILGAQGNVWTEYMKTTDHVEYMVFPRALALAEVNWSPRNRRDWTSFTTRLQTHFQRLADIGVSYRIPPVRGLETDGITLEDRLSVSLSTEAVDADIRYTTDGSDPTIESPRYDSVIELPVSTDGATVTARAFIANGRTSAPAAATFRKTALRPAENIAVADLERGANYAYYEGRFSSVVQLAEAEPVREGVARNVELQGHERDEFIGLRFNGYLRVPASDVYEFFLTSDDGSRLIIDDEVVIDHDEFHRDTEQVGVIALSAGFHSFTVDFFHGAGEKALHLTVQNQGEERRSSVAPWLFHR